MEKAIAVAVIGALVFAACERRNPAGGTDEMALAEQAQTVAQEIVASSNAHYEGWLRHLVDQLRHTDDPEARECLAEAHALRHWLVNHHAPQISAILQHARDLRSEGDGKLAAGDAVGALALNLEAFRVLHRLVAHIQGHHADHGAAAELEMASLNVEGL